MKRKFKEASSKSDGIYYVVYVNGKWKVEAFRTDQYGDVNHVEVWEERLAPFLARICNLDERDGYLLKLSYAGFPRGRVVRVGKQYIVYHGNNYKKLVSKDAIIAPFGINNAKFEFDDHERVIMDNRENIRQLLKIKDTWPAV